MRRVRLIITPTPVRMAWATSISKTLDNSKTSVSVTIPPVPQTLLVQKRVTRAFGRIHRTIPPTESPRVTTIITSRCQIKKKKKIESPFNELLPKKRKARQSCRKYRYSIDNANFRNNSGDVRFWNRLNSYFYIYSSYFPGHFGFWT